MWRELGLIRGNLLIKIVIQLRFLNSFKFWKLSANQPQVSVESNISFLPRVWSCASISTQYSWTTVKIKVPIANWKPGTDLLGTVKSGADHPRNITLFAKSSAKKFRRNPRKFRGIQDPAHGMFKERISIEMEEMANCGPLDFTTVQTSKKW